MRAEDITQTRSDNPSRTSRPRFPTDPASLERMRKAWSTDSKPVQRERNSLAIALILFAVVVIGLLVLTGVVR